MATSTAAWGVPLNRTCSDGKCGMRWVKWKPTPARPTRTAIGSAAAVRLGCWPISLTDGSFSPPERTCGSHWAINPKTSAGRSASDIPSQPTSPSEWSTTTGVMTTMSWPPCKCISRRGTLLWCVLFCCMTCPFVKTAEGQEVEMAADPSSNHEPEIYGAIYLLGSLAQNRNLNVGGEELSPTTVRDGAGGGFKAGVFPAFTHYVVGIQAESFGLGQEVTAPAS